jgi:hypothetical protein
MTGELISHPRIIDFDPNCEYTVCNPGVKFFRRKPPDETTEVGIFVQRLPLDGHLTRF